MKFEKPGKPKKHRTKLNPPADKYCRKCGRDCGDCAFRHAESREIKFQVGGGIMGSKIPDEFTAWLCASCDAILSQPLPKNATPAELEAHKIEWDRLIKLSH